jgi:uncharacterized membrane protein
MRSQLLGTFPAPLFLFLAGISFALVTEKLWSKNLSAGRIGRTTIKRGAEIFGFGLLFRLQEYVIGWGWAPTSDLFRVDILNTIGVSMMLMGVLCWLIEIFGQNRSVWGQPPSAQQPATAQPVATTDRRLPLIVASLASALVISLVTPLLWTTWRPRWLPWPIESYINGVHNFGTPQPWLFPVFPWTAFAFTGLAVGFILQSEWTRTRQTRVFFFLGTAGVLLIELSRWLDRLPLHIYPVYDYWHTSPEFFLIRVGMLLVILTATYIWCRWGAGQWGFSPLIQLGQASLLVYWVHIEFVYGRVSILSKHAQTISGATVGLITIFLAMLALAYLRTHTQGWMKNRTERTTRRVPAIP